MVDPDGVVHFKSVTISRDLGNYVELSSGVSPGALLALNVSNQVADGDKVHPNFDYGSDAPALNSQRVRITANEFASGRNRRETPRAGPVNIGRIVYELQRGDCHRHGRGTSVRRVRVGPNYKTPKASVAAGLDTGPA